MDNSIDKEALLKERLPFWTKLDKPLRQRVLRDAKLETFKAGEELLATDGACLGGFFVTKGIIRVYLMSEEGRKITIMRVRQGQPCFLGAGCVLHSVSFEAFMEAEQDSQCIMLGPALLNALFNDCPAAQNFALTTIAEHFSDVMWVMQQILFMSMDRRLAIFLYEEASVGKTTTLRFTQERIAKAVGSAREVISRMLRWFADEGIIRSFRGGVEILNMDKLKKLALHGM